MRTSAVVKGQIPGKGGPRLRHACVGVQVDLFVFDGPPQPLDEDVVAPCALAVHGDGDFGVLQHLDEVDGGELAALVGVEDVGLAVPGQRLFDGLDAEVRLKGDREPPRQDAAAEPVECR